MAELTREAAWQRCVFAFGQGAGPDYDLDAEILGALRQRLAPVVDSIDLARWSVDQTIAVETWKEAGRAVAESGETSFDAVADLLGGVFRMRPTSYCVEAANLLRPPTLG